MSATSATPIDGQSPFVDQAGMTGPDWWQAARRRAAADLALPTRRDEAWKYTPLKALEKRRFRALDGEATDAFTAEDICRDQPVVLRFVDGLLDDAEGAAKQLPDGLELQRAEDADLAMVRQCLECDFTGAADAMARLNTARTSEVWLLKAAQGQVIERPVLLQFHASQAEDCHPRLLVNLEKGAQLRLLEDYPEAAGNAFNNVVIQARLDEASSLEHVRLQRGGSRDLLVTRWDVTVQAAARFESLNADLGGQLVRHDLNIRLADDQAETTLRGIYPLSGRQHVDNHLRVRHASGNTRSEAAYRGVLGGRSQGVFNAKALIDAGSDGSDVVQSNANLLLSRHAEINTKPELEIYADDVTASHGATVGQLEEQALFYLQSRGIPRGQARSLLTRGFLQAVTAVPDWLDALTIDDWVSERLEAL